MPGKMHRISRAHKGSPILTANGLPTIHRPHLEVRRCQYPVGSRAGVDPSRSFMLVCVNGRFCIAERTFPRTKLIASQQIACMSAYMSRVMSRRFWWAAHKRYSHSSGPCALSGSNDDVHVSCEGSHQLISGSSVPACHNAECMDHRRGGMGLIFLPAHRPSGHGATHPTHQRSLSGGVAIALSVADGKVSYRVLTIAPSGIRPCSR
jgi:hypothetical protein